MPNVCFLSILKLSETILSFSEQNAFCSENDNIVSDNFKIDKKQTFGIIPPVGGG